MGDAQSAPEGGSDAAEEDGKVHEQFEEGQSLKNKDPIFEVNVEADSFKPEVTGHREEEIDAEDVPNDTDKEEPNRPEDVEDATKETTRENAEQYNDANVAQETYDNDSTTCPTVTDMTSEEVLENAEEKATETEAEIEEETVNEQNKVRLQKVIQHVKEHLPEAGAESLAVNLGQEGIVQPDVATQESEMIHTSEVEDQKEPAEGDASVLERRDEMSPVFGDIAATGKQATEDLMHESDTTPHSGITIHDGKDNAIEPLIVPPANAGLVEPQNTGVLLSTDNTESPSSLSIEFKLNIQLGRADEAATPPPTTERSEPAAKTDVPEVAVQATASTERAADSDSTERAVITTPPVLLDICIQATGPQFKAGERVTTSRDRATETTQMEKGNRDTQKEEEPAKPKEDQDVWMDAEEEVDAQEKRPGLRSESEREGTEAGLEQEVEVAPGSEEEERQREMPKTVKRRETDSEGEDFDIALKHPDTASVATMERN
ncbi:uncharacterized protein LOC130201686 [Pseudoliparis swirei]|uniref:uncharacterized protein LOC130201686 n=1 Tax=Pseudoliparis swirei TaxID=2059687 RepID=UPI0024BEF2E1|nr:uncharacterized protein LOC130201686 [Pseudoliparis swirei]